MSCISEGGYGGPTNLGCISRSSVLVGLSAIDTAQVADCEMP